MSASREMTAGAGPVDPFFVTRARFSRWAAPGGHLLLLWHCLRRLRVLFNPMVRPVFLRQVYYVGVMGLRAVALLALTIGVLLVTEITNLLGARNSYVYDIISWALVTEAAPLVVALVVIGRSATVFSTELALMKVRGELRYLEHMRIDPRDYLVLPRVVALTVSLLAATFYFNMISLAGGFAASALLLNVSFEEQITFMLEAVPLLGVIMAGIKSLVFGLAIGTIACFTGLYSGKTINDVAHVQVKAFMRSLVWIVVLDLLFAIAQFSVL